METIKGSMTGFARHVTIVSSRGKFNAGIGGAEAGRATARQLFLSPEQSPATS